MAVHRASRSDRDSRLDEAIAEYLEALDAGRRPAPADWLARFPDLAAELQRFFGDQDQVHHLLGALGATPPAADVTPPVPPPQPAPPGPLPSFGDYELLEEIARGGMGIVYRARQRSLNRIVALKMILAGRLASAADVQRFHSEAQAAANLEHPNIVPIHDVGAHEGQHYFTMKFIEGANLAVGSGQWAVGSPQRQLWAARMLKAVAQAVHYAHQHGILHRDLKPANILVDGQGQPHLTDFGLARQLQSPGGLTRTGTAVGTPGYMAPEQAVGRSSAITTAADVYSLGAILYELLCGRPPFRAEHPLETLRQVLEREPVRPRVLDPRLSRDLETICLKCLDKDPSRRYASAAELAGDLERFLRGEPVRARRVGRVERSWRWCRRRPVVAALSAALVLSLVVGASLLTWQWRRAEANFAWADEQWSRAEREATNAKAESSRAQSEESRAETERLRAEEGFRQAHKAVSDFCIKVSEGRMRDVAGLQQVRRELLESALAYFEKFLKERGDDPTLRVERADTTFRVATITSLIGSPSEALKIYARAQQLYEDIVKADPKHLPSRMWLAETHQRIGLLLRTTGQPAAALDALREAERLYGALVRDHPGHPSFESGTAAVLANLGNLYRSSGRTQEAFDCMRRARQLEEALTNRFPEDAHYRSRLAIIYLNLAGLEADEGRRAEARSLLRMARDLQEELLDEDPLNHQYQQDLAITCRVLSGELAQEKKFDEALTTVQRGQGLLEVLVRAEPGMAGLRDGLATGYRQAGHCYRGKNQLALALAQYDKGLAVMVELTRQHPEVPEYSNNLAKCHFDRAVTLSGLGRRSEALASYQTAAAIREDLVNRDPKNVGYHYDLGMTLYNVGITQRDRGHPQEALAAARACVHHYQVALQNSPRVSHFRTALSGAYAFLANQAAAMARLDEALAAVKDRQALWAGKAPELYAVAADLAKASTTWNQGADSDKLADLAMKALQEAVAAGFTDGRRLRGDPAFAALRGRANFEAIVNELPQGKER